MKELALLLAKKWTEKKYNRENRISARTNPEKKVKKKNHQDI